MTEYAQPVSHPWRRYLRFSVRGLIVLVLLIGALLGCLVRSARAQREAVAAIVNAGGSVTYDRDWSTANYRPAGLPWALAWLIDLIGVDYFGQVTIVALYDSSTTTDATIEQVGHLTRLRELLLFESSINDATLVHLNGLTNLDSLELAGVRVTDAGLDHLEGMTKLTVLSLQAVLRSPTRGWRT